MSYTPPAYNVANATWAGSSTYAAPGSSVANASWAPTSVTGVVNAPSPLGAPRAMGLFGGIPDGSVIAPSPLGAPTAQGAPVIVGRASGPSLLQAPAAIGRVVVAGGIAVASPLSVARIVGTVLRYELRGEVRDQGVLVNRRVRAYHRSTGAHIAEGDTVAGLFSLPVGFAADEYYLIAINLDPAATDFAPPCANRVTSVLAMDAA